MPDAIVLIVTAADDTTADLVADAVVNRGGRVARIDIGDFPTHLAITSQLGSDGIWVGELVTAEGTVDLAAVTSVYYRRPTRFRLPAHLCPADRRFADAEAHHGVGGLLAELPVRWVSHPARIADAESKPAQLQRAAACGFRTPRTLITNDPSKVRAFAEDVGGYLVYKPLSAGFLRQSDGLRAIYATRLGTDDVDAWLEPDALRLAPNQFQSWVDKTCDVRVTAVGDRLFAVAIHTTCPAPLVDWRSDYSVHEYRHIELPDGFAGNIRRYLAATGLAFGAFDFAQDRDGSLWWLECNPNGEWAWLAEAMGDPVAEALAELLLS